MPRQVLRTLAVAAALLAPLPASACPNCKDGVAESADPGAAQLAAGYSYSIYLMMGMPVVLIGGGTFAVVRAARQGLLPEM